MKIKVPEMLKEFRARSNLTQSQLAELIDTNRNRIMDFENDRSYPDAAEIMAACNALGISPNQLFGNYDDRGIVEEIIDGLNDDAADGLIQKFEDGMKRKHPD